MNLSAPEPLRTIDRTPSGLGRMAGVGNGVRGAGSGELRAGETFAQRLNRTRTLKNQETTEQYEGEHEAGPGAGETGLDYLNRKHVAAGADGVADTEPRAGESDRAFLNRRQGVQASSLNGAKDAGAKSEVKAGAATTQATTQPRVGETGAGVLNRTMMSDAPDAATEREEQADKAAGGLVSNALILPILKQVRRSPWADNGLFSGGIGEKTFGPEFDMQIADRIANSPRLGVRTALATKLMQGKRPEAVKGSELNKLDAHG